MSSTPMAAPYFEVDRKGLSQLLGRRGKAFVVIELVQNAWDEKGVTRVDVDLEDIDDGMVRLTVEDDAPEGFADLAYAYTLFKQSAKVYNPEQRGRFAIGEKLCLALAERGEIATTKGTVTFFGDRRYEYEDKREAGSRIVLDLRLDQEDRAELEQAISLLLPPQEIATYFRGQRLVSPAPEVIFKAQLPTEMADDNGSLKPVWRTAPVRVYEPLEGTGWLYEMGLPVVETGDRWTLSVGQKVPVTLDRANVVRPSYLRQLRVFALNATAHLLTEDDAKADWVRESLKDKRVTPEAVERVLTLTYGEKRVIFDPSDPEGTKLAVAKGYVVIPPGAFTKEAWQNIRNSGAAKPAGQVTPSPRPYDPEGQDLSKVLDPATWTPDMTRVVDYCKRVAHALIKKPINVRIVRDVTWPYAATFGRGCELTLNLGRLGHSFFAEGATERVNSLLIHELGHFYSSDHLSEDFHDALCDLGARMTRLALDEPHLFGTTEQAAAD